MSKFKVGDRVVVVSDDMAFGYWTGRRGEVVDPNTGLSISTRVHFDDEALACFREDELEFENVYDELSKPSEVVIGANLSEEAKAELAKLVSLSGPMVDKSGDSVNHPSHYTSHPSGVEAIQITEHMNFNLGNAVKYIWRAGLKSDDPTQDLQKALWYVTREVLRLGGTVG